MLTAILAVLLIGLAVIALVRAYARSLFTPRTDARDFESPLLEDLAEQPEPTEVNPQHRGGGASRT